jgi:hypothetical protein
MGDAEDFQKSFRDERFGPGAGVPTSLGGTLGQISARQQKDLADGTVQGGASGALLLEMIRGGMISRGFLLVIAGFALAVGGVNGTPGSWFVPAGMIGGWTLMLLGIAMVAVGTIGRIFRAFR